MEQYNTIPYAYRFALSILLLTFLGLTVGYTIIDHSLQMQSVELSPEQIKIIKLLGTLTLTDDDLTALHHALKALASGLMGLPRLSPDAAQLYKTVKNSAQDMSPQQAQSFIKWVNAVLVQRHKRQRSLKETTD